MTHVLLALSYQNKGQADHIPRYSKEGKHLDIVSVPSLHIRFNLINVCMSYRLMLIEVLDLNGISASPVGFTVTYVGLNANPPVIDIKGILLEMKFTMLEKLTSSTS